MGRVAESNPASHSSSEDQVKQNEDEDEDQSEDMKGDDGDSEGDEECDEEEGYDNEEEEESQVENNEESEEEEDEKEGKGLPISDDDPLTPLPESPPRTRPSPVGITTPASPIPQPLLVLTNSPEQLSLLSAQANNTAAPGRNASTTLDRLGIQRAASEEPVALSAPPRFKRKRTYHTNTDSLLEGEPDDKRARLRASMECDTIPTPSLSISSLPTASESSASSRSTSMSPSESHINLPHSSHLNIDTPSAMDVEDKELFNLPSLSCHSLSVNNFTQDSHARSRESLSLRSRLWDAWLP